LEKIEERSDVKWHEYWDCTKRLLEKVSVVLRCMDVIRRGEGRVEEVEVALKAVKLEKRQLQEETMWAGYVRGAEGIEERERRVD